MEQAHRVVIVGGGFGGLYAARALKRVPAEIVLIDRKNHHLFQPLLYQVATGVLSPANIASPLRVLLRRQANIDVLMAEVADIDVPNRRLVLSGEPRREVAYDTLIVAAGAQFNYFGHNDWVELAPGLKSIEDALDIRRRVLSVFERAELETDLEGRQAAMTFVVVGGGPTGVEMAGALAEVAHHAMARDFKHIRPQDTKVLLIESQDHILTTFPPGLRQKAVRSLEHLGVTVHVNAMVTEISQHGVTFKSGETTHALPADSVFWTAGVKASPLGAVLAQAAGLTLDRLGRVAVEPDLTLRGHPNIFVIGDLANCSHQHGSPLPGVAPVAMQQGRYVGKVIARRLAGRQPPKPFRYFDRGNMATIGRAAAVADLGWIHLSGYLAWLAWLFVHLLNLAQFQNRVLVSIQWAYNYFTRGRSARLITEETARTEPPVAKDRP